MGYAVLLSIRPLRVFLCPEGLVRVCTEPYKEPTGRTAHRINCHLTNYSVSKYSTEFVHSDDPADGTKGTKRSWTSTQRFLKSLGYDVGTFNEQIHNIVAMTTEAMSSAVTHHPQC